MLCQYLWGVDGRRGGGSEQCWCQHKETPEYPCQDSVPGLVNDQRAEPPVQTNHDREDHHPLKQHRGKAVYGDLPPCVRIAGNLIHHPPGEEPHPLNGSYESGRNVMTM